MRVLIVEDEKLLADSIQIILKRKGYDAEVVYDGESGYHYAQSGVYDLIVLDVMLPGMDGYEIVRNLRAERNGVPVLMLTARSGLEDRIEGLDAGADYYLTKPFDNRELLACVNALIRRQGTQVDILSMGNTSLDLGDAFLRTEAKKIRLSVKEFEVMRMLLISREQNLSKNSILVKVWGFESDAVENNVEVYVGFIRKKLRAIGSNLKIEAVRGMGYHLEVEDEITS